MKRLFDIIFKLLSALLTVIGLAFTVIEGRLVFSGDFLLYSNEYIGFLQYFLRLLLALTAIATGIIGVLGKDRFPFPSVYALAIGIGLVFFTTNGFNIIFSVFGAIYFLSSILKYRFDKKGN